MTSDRTLPTRPGDSSRMVVRRMGVTLIEVVLVVMILGAAALATSFSMRSDWSNRRAAKASTIDVSQLLKIARNTAIEKRTTVHVAYSGKTGAMQVDIVEDAGPLTPGRTWSAPLASEVEIKGKPNPIDFLADGSANSSLQWQVVSDGVQGEVSVTPVGGAVQYKVP